MKKQCTVDKKVCQGALAITSTPCVPVSSSRTNFSNHTSTPKVVKKSSPVSSTTPVPVTMGMKHSKSEHSGLTDRARKRLRQASGKKFFSQSHENLCSPEILVPATEATTPNFRLVSSDEVMSNDAVSSAIASNHICVAMESQPMYAGEECHVMLVRNESGIIPALEGSQATSSVTISGMVFDAKGSCALFAVAQSQPVTEVKVSHPATVMSVTQSKPVNEVKVSNPATVTSLTQSQTVNEVNISNPAMVTSLTQSQPVNEVNISNPATVIYLTQSQPMNEVNISYPATVMSLTQSQPVTEVKVSNPATVMSVTQSKLLTRVKVSNPATVTSMTCDTATSGKEKGDKQVGGWLQCVLC